MKSTSYAVAADDDDVMMIMMMITITISKTGKSPPLPLILCVNAMCLSSLN